MKTLYLECNMGAAGDMLMGALLELIPDREKFLKKLNQAGLPHVKVSANPAVKCGITGTHVSVAPKKRVRRYPYREADLNLRKCMNTTTGIHTPMDIITMRG